MVVGVQGTAAVQGIGADCSGGQGKRILAAVQWAYHNYVSKVCKLCNFRWLCMSGHDGIETANLLPGGDPCVKEFSNPN